jgi:hypothetical protein
MTEQSTKKAGQRTPPFILIFSGNRDNGRLHFTPLVPLPLLAD